MIDRLGYQPSALARSLIQQRSYTLGVVTAGLRHIGPSRTLSGITAEAAAAGYALLLEELPRYDTDDTTPIFQALISRHVDGIIWAVPEVGDESPLDRATCRAEPRCRSCTWRWSRGRTSRWYRSTTTLGRGWPWGTCWRRVTSASRTSPDRWTGGRRGSAWPPGRMRCRRRAWRLEDRCWAEGNWSPASGAEAAQKLFKQYPEMDAVFVANDQMALSVLHTAPQHGRKVPQDLGVVGFDNIPESAYFRPALTTVQQDQYNVGKVAVEEITRIIESTLAGTGAHRAQVHHVVSHPDREAQFAPPCRMNGKGGGSASEMNETQDAKRCLLSDGRLQASTSACAIGFPGKEHLIAQLHYKRDVSVHSDATPNKERRPCFASRHSCSC